MDYVGLQRSLAGGESAKIPACGSRVALSRFRTSIALTRRALLTQHAPQDFFQLL